MRFHSALGWVPAAATAAFLLLPPIAPAAAQSDAAGMAGVGRSATVTVRGAITAIDTAARKVTLRNQKGHTVTVTVPADVGDLSRVQVGDVVMATLRVSLRFVQSQPGIGGPKPSTTMRAGAARDGNAAAGAVSDKIVRTAVVMGVNPADNTVQLVDPAGGEVRTLHVRDPEMQQMLPRLRVGAIITMIATEVFAVAWTRG